MSATSETTILHVIHPSRYEPDISIYVALFINNMKKSHCCVSPCYEPDADCAARTHSCTQGAAVIGGF